MPVACAVLRLKAPVVTFFKVPSLASLARHGGEQHDPYRPVGHEKMPKGCFVPGLYLESSARLRELGKETSDSHSVDFIKLSINSLLLRWAQTMSLASLLMRTWSVKFLSLAGRPEFGRYPPRFFFASISSM